jgi:hypothetical protein
MKNSTKVGTSTFHTLILAFGLASALAVSALAAEPWSAIISPENSVQFSFVKNTTPVFRLGLGGWGPNWAWVGVGATEKATGDKLVATVPFVVNRANGEVIDIKFQAWKSAPRQISFRYDLSAAKDVPVTMVIASLGVEKAFAKGKLALSHADGTEATLNLPFGRSGQPTTAKAVFSMENTGDIGITLDPPCPISFDGDMRIILASDVFKQGERSTTITLTLPDETAFLAKQTDLDRLTRTLAGPDWFPFTPADDVGPSVISMNDWLDQPAGKHGGVRTVGDHFEFSDKTPVKFWGVNLSYGTGCAPEKKGAEFTAARYGKYGINGVRLHKFTYPKNQMGIGDPSDATRMDPDGLDRLDYFAAQLKTNGIYFGWSHTFKFQVSPGNRNRLVAYDEIAQHLKGDTYAFINFAEDVQDLMIEMVVNLLKHQNPYTGLSYADEPALSFIELQNEDDIFFWTSEQAFNACPTYRKLFIQRFSDWLKVKYDTDEKLKQAWGNALKADESLAARNILPQTNPWSFTDGFLPGQKDGPRQRLLDILSRGSEAVLGGMWSNWRRAADGLALVMGDEPPPKDDLDMWQWIRTPMPPRSEHRDFEILRRSLEMPDDQPSANGTDGERLKAPDKTRVRQMFPRFLSQHNPFIRHIVRRSRKYLEETKDPTTGEPYLKPIAVELLGERGEDAIRLPLYLREAYTLAEQFCHQLSQRMAASPQPSARTSNSKSGLGKFACCSAPTPHPRASISSAYPPS